MAESVTTYYHVTSYKNWPAIRDGGLRPSDGHVWLFTNAEAAMRFKDAWDPSWHKGTSPETWTVPPCIIVVRTDRAVPTSAGIPGAYWVEGPVTKTEVYDVIRPEDMHHYASTGSVEAKAGQDYSDFVMVCLKPPEEIAKAIIDMDEYEEDPDEIHLTLLYLGTKEDAGGAWGEDRLYRGLYDFAINAGYRGLTGKMNGFGVFQNEDADVLVSLWDIPGIAEFRTHLKRYLEDHGAKLRQDDHGFTPHMTLAYSEGAKIREIPKVPSALRDEKVIFTSVWLVWGDEWTEVTLS